MSRFRRQYQEWTALVLLLAVSYALPTDVRATHRDEHRPNDFIASYESGDTGQAPSRTDRGGEPEAPVWTL